MTEKKRRKATVTPAAPPTPTPPAAPPPGEEPRPGPAAIAGAIGPDSPARQLGDLPPATIRRVLAEAGSHIPPEAILAATPHTAMALAVAYKESSLGKTAPAGSFNAFGIGPGKRFTDWASGTRDFARRLSTVAEPYLPEGISLERFLQIYVGGPMCPSLIAQGKACANFEDADSIGVYVWQSLERINAWRGQGGTTPAPGPVPIAFGTVPHPPFEDRPVRNSTAWDDLGPRVIVGCCTHSMIGSLQGTDNYFRTTASGSALTDYGVGGATDGNLDGAIYRWNDPRGRRSPWASGPANDLEGDGPAFVRVRGVAGVNRDLVSIERSDGGRLDTPMSPKQVESICALQAYWADQARIPWDAYPVNPAIDVVTDLQHWEFGPKECPFAPVRSRTDEMQDRVRAILKRHQTGSAGPSEPPPGPVTPGSGYPVGMTPELAAEFFGLLRRESNGRDYPFDPKGVISSAWLARGNEEGEFPEADWWREKDGDARVRFRNGWGLAYDGGTDGRGWYWIGLEDEG